jgi:hypothetical protein
MKEDKWNVKKKGYSKIHITVDIKSKKILSMIKVTDEHVHDDSKALPELVENIARSDNVTIICKIFADDGAYDGNDIFRYLSGNGILPCIKVRNNAKFGWKKGNMFRNLSVISQKNDLKKWKDSVGYGKRGIVEIVFSCIKRMFGE